MATRRPANTTATTAATTAANTAQNIKYNLQLLFDRPTEPVFVPKGPGRTVFQVPDSFLPDRYRAYGTELATRFGTEAENTVAVRNISLPDITIPLQLGRYEQFSLFNPRHREMAGRLIDIFMDSRTLEDLQSSAVYCRDNINPYLFNYAMSVALLHRTDTRDVAVPNIIETFPDKYFSSAVFTRAREETAILPDGSRNPIVIPRDFTATNADPEHLVAYFREDLGINLHHWHWHLVYPFTANNRAIVDKDRRGELFYYMHHQLVARYNAERFGVGLPEVAQFNDVTQPIAEGYFPKLDSTVASRAWPPRFPNVTLNSINRPNDGMTINIDDFATWAQRFRAAIEQGFVVDANQAQIELTEAGGIDILGNIMESSILNPNAAFYGDIHNFGHMLIAYAHDPDGRYLEPFSVMGDSATAMRDPIFYRWHAYIDELFLLHKVRLPSYTAERLNFPGVSVTNVEVANDGGAPNQLQTYWQQSELDMARGLDFARNGSVYVRFTHLQHEEFRFRITVNNSNTTQSFGTVRIFMAPHFGQQGNLLSFAEQRQLMIELDKFRVGLRPGNNTIMRQSTESSVTIPYERTFRNLNLNRPAAGAPGEQLFNFCGCGWPQHMLIPRGTERGMAMDLFVMVSNFADDRVVQDMAGVCDDADSYCGINNRLYPDRQPMGYPFDRTGRVGVTTLTDFLTPNMAVQQVNIMHTDRTVLRANPNRQQTNQGNQQQPANNQTQQA